ncbi:MAG TPA: hypothetical protein VEH81_03840 [Ktedonobacteraceae bacterium]|nr:hypothetical protein [Ktedonobacteraceae bacterium]HYB02060.1 hypothetical protein [Ktedonobacteraceae bacterium]
MTGNSRQFQPKHFNEDNKSDLSPLILSPTRSRRHEAVTEDELLAEDDAPALNPPRTPTSSIRLNTTSTGRRTTTSRDVSIETTRQQIPVPARRTTDVYSPTTDKVRVRYRRGAGFESAQSPVPGRNVEQKRIHWLLYVGVGMIAALALWVTASTLLAWGTEKYNDIIYGNPRIYQTDHVVGHNHDSLMHPSHFIALNLHGQVIIVELPAGDPTKSIDYIGPALIAVGDDKIPITLSFSDVNNDHKVDMIVHIQDKEVRFCNNGTRFTACN